MTTDIKQDLLQVAASIDLTPNGMKFKGITVGGTIAADVKQAIGILRHGSPAGGGSSVVYRGISKVLVGAAVTTVGIPLKLTTSGFTLQCVSGDQSYGRAMTTAASGDLLLALIDFTNLGLWGG